MRKDYDIVGSYDNQRVSSISCSRTVNMFEYIDVEGKRPKSLLPTSGLVNVEINLGSASGGCRQSFVFNDAIYQVFGDQVFRTIGPTGNLSSTLIGTLTTSTGIIRIDANTFQVIFVDGTSGYIWDTNASTFEKITDTGFPSTPTDVCYLDGFFLVIHGGTNEFQLSSFNQGMVWSGEHADFTADAGNDTLTLSTNSANFATGVPISFTTTGSLPAPLETGPPKIYYSIRIGNSTTIPGTIKVATTYDNAIHGIAIDITSAGSGTNTVHVEGQVQLGKITSHPGTLVGCRTLHRRIFLFSNNYTEVWENAGIGTNLPFRRNNSSLMEVGAASLGSIVVGFDKLFFLAQDKDGLAGVMEVQGTESNLISNRALDYQLAQYAADPDLGVSDATAILVKENGIIFYRLNFTKANHTFVFNVSMSSSESQKWHEEEVLNGDRHPAQTHAYFLGVNYYGDYKRPVFYRVDDKVSTNAGEVIRRMRIGRQISPEGYNRMRVDRFQLDVLQGAQQLVKILSTFTVDLSSNLMIVATNDKFWQTGDAVQITGTGSLPSPLVTNFTYYVIRIGSTIPARIKLASTEEDALEGNAIILTTVGTPINVVQLMTRIVADIQPEIFLAISKDGGQTYGNYIKASMGKIGERKHRSVWRKLGSTPRGQGYTPKIEFFNEIPFIILGAAWDFSILPE